MKIPVEKNYIVFGPDKPEQNYGVCSCTCHIYGSDIDHFDRCCALCGQKFSSQDGVDVCRWRELVLAEPEFRIVSPDEKRKISDTKKRNKAMIDRMLLEMSEENSRIGFNHKESSNDSI